MDWDLTSYFSEFGDESYLTFKKSLKAGIEELDARARRLLEDGSVRVETWESVFIDVEPALARFSHLSSYISCLTAAEAKNTAYQKEESFLAELQALNAKLSDKLIRGLGLLSDDDFQQLLASDKLQGAGFRLEQWRREAVRRMPAELEDLAADLGVNGLSAWSRLYFTTMGNLSFRYDDPETGLTDVPMAQLNSLLCSGNRERRKAAADGAAKTFEEHQHMYAACLNSLSGTRHTLNQRRGVADFLDPSLRQSRISRDTLFALMQAIEDRLPFAREVFTFRCSRMGIEDPGWNDLRAPLPIGEAKDPDWEQGVAMVSKAFHTAYPALGGFFDELIEKRQIDYTPREGKRPGGFCTGSLMTRESRIFMTYKDSLNDVLTLAHEAGHAWHSRILKDQRVLAASYPMTLAETASTFAERMLARGLLGDDRVDDSTKLVMLDAEVEHMLAFLLDLPIRFRFEEAVYGRRATSTLGPGELCDLMRATQRKIFGEAMAEGGEEPWFWASKMHFYINQVQFYNYPYTFGYLLSNAFMEHVHDVGSSGLETYERFLSLSGRMSCEDVVRETLGRDISDPAFWSAMIDGLGKPFALYQELLDKQLA